MASSLRQIHHLPRNRPRLFLRPDRSQTKNQRRANLLPGRTAAVASKDLRTRLASEVCSSAFTRSALTTGKVARTRGQKCPPYVAQAFQPAGSGDFPVSCSNDVRIIPESSDVQRFTT